jgi:tyrosine-protein kinase Etk/Wzc
MELKMKEQTTEASKSESWNQHDGSSGSHGQQREIGILELLTVFASRKSLFAKLVGASTTIGIILCFVLPVQYTATTKLMPPQQTQSTTSMMMNQLIGSSSGSLAAIAGGGIAPKSPNDIYIGLLSSRPVGDAIIQRFGLTQVYRAKDMTASREKLAANTLISTERSGFIAISVTDRDSKRASDIANAYTEQLRAFTRSLAVTEASRRRLFYDDQLRQAKESLVQAEIDFQQVQQQKGLVQLDAQAKAIVESLAALRAKIAAKEVEVEALKSYSTDSNPEVELALNELSSLRSQATHIATQDKSDGFADLGLKQVPAAELEYLRADRELRYRQALFDMLIKQYDAAKMDEAKDAAIIQVVEPATIPERRSAPKRVSVLLAWIFVGFASSCILVLVQSWQRMVRLNPNLQNRLKRFRDALLH